MSDTNAGLPSVRVFYKLAHPKNEPPTIDLSNLPGKLEAADTKVKDVGAHVYLRNYNVRADTSKERFREWQDRQDFRI